MTLIQIDPPASVRSLDDAIDQVSKELGIPKLGGASGIGWSYISQVQICPRKFYLTYVKKEERDFTPQALSIGSCFHFLRAIHRGRQMKGGYLGLTKVDEDVCKSLPTPERVKNLLIEYDADAQIIEETWRIFDGYQLRFESDYIQPLAVEYWAKSDDPEYSCRYDEIGYVEKKNDLGVAEGIYIVEGKTSGRFTASTMNDWQHHGEIIGQQMIYRDSGLTERFGELKGVIVDLVGKQKMQKFHRTVIPIEEAVVNEFRENVEYWKNMIKGYKDSNYWPRCQANCLGQYGPCDWYHGVCWI